jgi:hypothetical protein
LPRQTVWQKLKRIQPSVESSRPTAWTLVDMRQRPRTTVAAALAPALIPEAAVEPGSTDPRSIALGSFVRTGEICPASGWWLCEEPHALDGARWFAQGTLMPPASFQVPAGVFGKSAGPELIQRRSTWQLMRRTDAGISAQAISRISDGLPIGDPPLV